MVLQRVGRVAYRLDLPPDAKIHPVVHVSQLKRYVPPTTLLCTDISVICNSLDLLPERVLDSRTVLRGATTVFQELIQWRSLPSNMPTWEDAKLLHMKFPEFVA